MCLSKIEQVFDPPQQGVKKGFKVLEIVEDGKKQFPHMLTEISIGDDWVKDSNTYDLDTHSLERYRTGFHVFLNRADAISYWFFCDQIMGRRYKYLWSAKPGPVPRVALPERTFKIFEVEYDDVVAIGEQPIATHPNALSLSDVNTFHPCIVARKLRVLACA